MNRLKRFFDKPVQPTADIVHAPVEASLVDENYITKSECALNMNRLKDVIDGLENDKQKLKNENEKYGNNKIQEVFNQIQFYKLSLYQIMRLFNLNKQANKDFNYNIFKKESANSEYTLTILGKNLEYISYIEPKRVDISFKYEYKLKDNNTRYYLEEAKEQTDTDVRKYSESKYPFYFVQYYGEGKDGIFDLIMGGKRHRKSKKAKKQKSKKAKKEELEKPNKLFFSCRTK